MSRHKIHVPIFALTAQSTSLHKMALYRNVRPLLVPSYTDRDEALGQAEAILVARGVLKPGDTYAITCGEPMGYPGGTNMLKVCEVKALVAVPRPPPPLETGEMQVQHPGTYSQNGFDMQEFLSCEKTRDL